MKKILSLFLALVLLVGCSTSSSKKKFKELSDFNGATIAVLTGSAFPELIGEYLTDVTYKNLNSYADELAAVKANRVDAMAGDSPTLYLFSKLIDGFEVFPEFITDSQYGFAVEKGSELLSKGNEAIKRLRDNGTLKKLEEKWLSDDASKKVISELTYKDDFDGSAGTLRYACSILGEPMCYVGAGGVATGLDIDIISHIAYELNMKIEIQIMNFDSLIISLEAQKIDIAGSSMSITEERKKKVDFIGPYYDGGVALLIRKDRLIAK